LTEIRYTLHYCPIICVDRNTIHQGSQRRGPPRAFCAARDAFWEFSNSQHYVAKCLEKIRREIIESNLNDTQCGFRPGRSNTDHISHQQKFEKSWKYAKDVITCFVDLEKAYDRVPRKKLWGVLR